MNIKELAEQAGYSEKVDWYREYDKFDIERFAELVAEQTHTNNKAKWYQEGYEAGQRDMSTKSQNVNTSEERVQETDKSIHEPWDTSDMAYRPNGLSVEQEPLCWLKETGSIGGGYEQTAWGDTSGFPVFTAPPSKPKKEPIAWEKSYDIACALLRQAHDILATTQYPIKRPWVSLTDEEIDTWNIVGHESLREFVRAIEAALRSKNT